MSTKLFSIAMVTLGLVFLGFGVYRIGGKPILEEEKVCEAKGGVLVRTYSDFVCIKVERL